MSEFGNGLLDAWSPSLNISWTKGDTDRIFEETCTLNMEHLEKRILD